jgi:DNA-binding MarR family transcriptional regulator
VATDDRLRNFGFLLKEVSRRYVQRFEARARAISLTLPQCKVLVRLEKNQGVSQARLAELAEVDAMTMVRILDRMEADGLLERRADPSDRRARCLYLTAKARPLLDEIWRLSEATRAETFHGMSRAERDGFMDILERLHDNLAASERKPPSGGC